MLSWMHSINVNCNLRSGSATILGFMLSQGRCIYYRMLQVHPCHVHGGHCSAPVREVQPGKAILPSHLLCTVFTFHIGNQKNTLSLHGIAMKPHFGIQCNTLSVHILMLCHIREPPPQVETEKLTEREGTTCSSAFPGSPSTTLQSGTLRLYPH